MSTPTMPTPQQNAKLAAMRTIELNAMSANPAPPQNIILTAKLRKLEIGDSVQFKPVGGGQPLLMKVSEIIVNKRDADLPRMIVGYRASKRYYTLEDRVMHVIKKSTDEYEDLTIPDAA